MASPAWLTAIFAAASLAVAVYCAGRLVVARRGHRPTELATDGADGQQQQQVDVLVPSGPGQHDREHQRLVALAAAVLTIGNPSPFIYFQF